MKNYQSLIELGARLKALLENELPDLAHLVLGVDRMGVDDGWKARDW